MFTYQSLLEACREKGLDPEKRGPNELDATNSYRLDTFRERFDLTSIDFPSFELEQILKIGEMINNLVSQTKFGSFHSGLEDLMKDRSITKMITFLEESIQHWLSKGLEKCTEKKDLVTYHGFVYEINPEYQISMDTMNKEMADVHRDFIRKQANSEREAERVILR